MKWNTPLSDDLSFSGFACRIDANQLTLFAAADGSRVRDICPILNEIRCVSCHPVDSTVLAICYLGDDSNGSTNKLMYGWTNADVKYWISCAEDRFIFSMEGNTLL
jgi:hypothetical protein